MWITTQFGNVYTRLFCYLVAVIPLMLALCRLYDEFLAIGGKPETKHPLSFVVEGSKYLKEWFGNGIETRIPIHGIDRKHISFTLGDSGAEYGRNGSVKLLGLQDMTELLAKQTGDFDDFLNSIGKQYVEVQLWSDKYIIL